MAQSTVQQLEDIARDVSLKADSALHCKFCFHTKKTALGRMVRRFTMASNFSRNQVATVDYGTLWKKRQIAYWIVYEDQKLYPEQR